MSKAQGSAAKYLINFDEIQPLYRQDPFVIARPQIEYDYLIITADGLSNAITASTFIDWKTSLGFSPRIVFVSDPEITGQAGHDLAEKIRNFLRIYSATWNIRYVLLVGDLSFVPMRLCYPNPADHAYNPGNPSNCGGAVPTDYYYADLSLPDNLSWDSDGDGYYGEYGQDLPDFAAELQVGRIPTGDPSRITYALNKIVSYEQDTGAWKDNALHPGAILFFEDQDYSGHPLIDGARCLDDIEKDLMSGWGVEHFSERTGLTTSPYPWPALTISSFTAEWRNGSYGMVNWSGHGWPSGAYRTLWMSDDGDGVPETDGSDGMSSIAFIDKTAVLDDDHPSIVFAVSCKVGYPEPNSVGNLGVDLLTKEGSGAAVAVLSASRNAAVSVEGHTGGGAETICYEFNRFLLNGPDGPQPVGDALFDAKLYGTQTFGWDHFYEFQNLFDYNLYGDPSLVREGVTPIVCGDASGDDQVNVSDAVYVVAWIFKGGPGPVDMVAADADCNGQNNISDAVHIVNWVFKGGPDPCCP
jgi:hypothetical protein